jgi:homogentisate 1,2-dioxygenase
MPLFNAEVAMLYAEPDREDQHFYRNGQADELVYVSKGKGTLETVFGELPFGRELPVIHRGILHRYRFDQAGDPPADHQAGHIRSRSGIATSSAS